MVKSIPEYDAAQALSANLRKAMSAHKQLNSAAALGARCGVAATSIGYMLSPKRRAPTKKGASSPTLANIEKVARALGMQAWQLIYPDPENMPVSTREQQLHAELEKNFRELRDIAASRGAANQPNARGAKP